MSNSLENKVRYFLDVGLNRGLDLLESSPDKSLKVLRELLEKIDEFKERLNGVLEQGDLLEDIFPRNVIFDMIPNFMKLEVDLVGRDAGGYIHRDDLSLMGFRELRRKKANRRLKRQDIKEFKFEGEVYRFGVNVACSEIFGIFEKAGREHEIRSFGLDIERAYKQTFISLKPTEFNQDLHDYLRFYHEFSEATRFLSSVFCFGLKVEAVDFRPSLDPSGHIESVYTKFSLLKDDYDYLRNLQYSYWQEFDKYQHIGRYRYFDFNEEALDGDIAIVSGFVDSWEHQEGYLVDVYDDLDTKGMVEEVEVLDRYLQVLSEDKVGVDDLNEYKQIEASVLRDNSAYKMKELQMQIRNELYDIVSRWAGEIRVSEFLEECSMPKLYDFGDIEWVEFDKASLDGLDALKVKYIDLFLEEVDLSELFAYLESENINPQICDTWKHIHEFRFSDRLNEFKFGIFIDIILRLIFRTDFYDAVDDLLKKEYEKYLNRVPGFNECVELEDYLKLWCVTSEENEPLRKLIKERVSVLVDSVDVLNMEPEDRVLLRGILDSSESENLIYLTDYQLIDASNTALKLRRIESFMKALGAEKVVGSSSHVKYMVSLGDGHFYSYTISTSVIQSGKYFASKLLQDISISNKKPRSFSKSFVDRIGQAFRVIGLELVKR